MPIYPIFRCDACDCAVQMESLSTNKSLPTYRLDDTTLYSLRLDSDEFDKYCRGQGEFYAAKRALLYASPVGANHFNFSGAFKGLCCYCALGIGWCSASFHEIGCHQCKRRLQAVAEFSKLKRMNAEGSRDWGTCGWGGLSDSLVDYILRMVVGERAKLTVR